MADTATLVLKVVSDVKDATKGLDQVTTRSDKMRKGLKVAAAGAAVALVALGGAAIAAGKAAAEDAQSAELLRVALQKTTGATDAQVAATDAWITKMSLATGVADDKLRPAMATLARATGDVETSQAALSVALDVAAATGADVESVSKALAKGYAGQTTAIGRLVPGLDKATLASGDMSKVMDELKDKTGGSAAAAADTTAGKMARMTVAMDEAKESIGAGMLPVMEKFAGVMLKVGQFIQKHPTLFQALAVAVGVLAASVMVLNVAMMILSANPVVLLIVGIVAAVALLIAGFVLLYKRSETVRRIVDALFADMKRSVAIVASFLKSAFRIAFALVTGYVNAYKAVVLFVWHAIRTAAKAVADFVKAAWKGTFDAIKSAVGTVRTVVNNAWDAVKNKAGEIADKVQSAWETTFTALKTAATNIKSALTAPFVAIENAIQNVIDIVVRLIGKLSSIKVPKIDLPGPLSVGGNAAPVVATAQFAAPAVRTGTRTAAAGGGGTTIVVNGAVDPEATARQIRRILRGHDRRVGLSV